MLIYIRDARSISLARISVNDLQHAISILLVPAEEGQRLADQYADAMDGYSEELIRAENWLNAIEAQQQIPGHPPLNADQLNGLDEWQLVLDQIRDSIMPLYAQRVEEGFE